MAGRGYDGGSGQMYTETAATVFSRSKPASWVHESPFLPAGWEEGCSVGASSLKHIAMKQALLDQRRLTAAHFARVPWHIAAYLWDSLGRSGKRTMYAWKVFAAAYPQEFKEVSRHHCMEVDNKSMLISDYLGLLKSDPLCFGVVLTLSSEFTVVSDLVGVAKVTNLVGLDITRSVPAKSAVAPDTPESTNLNDRILRSWSEQARTGAAFKYLRVMMVRGSHKLSEKMFQYLDSFPVLVTFVVEGTSDLSSDATKAVAARYGWEVSDEWPSSSHLPATYRLFSDCRTLYDTFTKCLLFANADLDGVQKYRVDSTTPILEFALEPRKLPTRGKNAKRTWFFRQNPLGSVNPRPEIKKRKMTVSGEQGRSNNTGKRPRGAPLRRRPGKDIAGLLAEFYR